MGQCENCCFPTIYPKFHCLGSETNQGNTKSGCLYTSGLNLFKSGKPAPGIPAPWQNLVLAGQPLQDENVLTHYSIQAGQGLVAQPLISTCSSTHLIEIWFIQFRTLRLVVLQLQVCLVEAKSQKGTKAVNKNVSPPTFAFFSVGRALFWVQVVLACRLSPGWIALL